jgi:uncharacterized protein YhaN
VNITALEIDGYGAWSGLKVPRLGEQLSVLYGPNEAGKTTLLCFVRSMLYGFSPERRGYLPPLRGGRPGGWIELAGPAGRFQVARHDDAGGQPGSEELTLTAADGTRQGEHMLKVLLSNIDEQIFSNIFAVGLREMQELGTLSDGEAAEFLYNLSAGVDRVSLVDVLRELESSRNRLLDRGGGPCQVAQLLAEREKIRQEIEQLDDLMHRYGQLAVGRLQLDREVARLEEEKNAAEYESRVVELALGLRDRWRRRAELDDELAALGPQSPLPPDAIARLDALNARIRKHQQQRDELGRQRQELRGEGAHLAVNEALRRQAPRIEAMQEQLPWIAALEGQVAAAEKESAELSAAVADEHKRLGLDERGTAVALPSLSPRTLGGLRTAARAVLACRRQRAEARQAAAAAQEAARTLAGQLEVALSSRQDRQLPAAIDRAGGLVAQLRRRVEIDQRLQEMDSSARELDRQSRRLLERQSPSIWLLAGLGTIFVAGVVLLMSGLLMPTAITGSQGWALTLVGLAGSIGAGLVKIMRERAASRRLDGCQKQISILQLQVKQTGADRDALDGQLAAGGGPLPARLAAAEKELAALEELLPLETRRGAAGEDAAAAGSRLAHAEQDLAAARRRWREAVRQAGLPPGLAPKCVKQLSQRCERIGQLQRQLAQRSEELAHRRRELESLTARIAQLVADSGVSGAAAAAPAEQLRQLGEAIGRQETVLARREAIRQQLRQIARERTKHEEAAGRRGRRRRELLREAGARDEQEFRRRAVEAARAETLQQQRQQLDREINETIAGHCPQEAVRRQLEGDSGGLEPRREELLRRVAAADQGLKERFERRGQLAEQLKTLAEDRQLAQKQLELAVVQQRLDEGIRRWQVLAVTCRTLDVIRATYEQQRQPETLQEASGYLQRLTQGRYVRVWTPLGENVLRVDDADGHVLPVEALSRGTREQLFLSLRLALAACYARRGAPLPLVLDDVLVNFDADRAGAAAAVLRDFAAAGHQVLIFTCHEHILRLFQALKAPVGRLPDARQSEHATVVLEEPAKEKPKRARKSPAPRKTPARIQPPQPHEEPGDGRIVDPSGDDASWDAESDADDEGGEADWDDQRRYDEGGAAAA